LETIQHPLALSSNGAVSLPTTKDGVVIISRRSRKAFSGSEGQECETTAGIQ
jgi:hypothetical protein